MAIRLLYVIGPHPINPLHPLQVQNWLYMLDSEVDFQQQLSMSRLLRLSQNPIQD